jgi:cell division protein FtsA
MKTQIAVGLDAGSSRTRCVIGAVEGLSLRYLGHADVPGAGWAKGRLADAAALAGSIQAAVQEAEKRAGVQVEALVIGVGGSSVNGANSRGVYEFGRPHEVEEDDLAYAVELASRVRLQDNRVLMHVLPQDFTLDGRTGFRKPARALCSRLEANVHVITAAWQEHQGLIDAVHQAHLAVEETVFEPLAAAYATVTPEERAQGVAVIDFGLESIDMVVYDGDAMLLATALPVSSDHLTRDVAWVLKTSYEDAEILKQQYGCALLGLTADSSLIEIPGNEGRPSREAKRRELNEILEARAEEIFLHVRSELARVQMEQSLREGVVLVGGGALLNGLCDMAERVLNCQARNGLAIGIAGWPNDLSSPECSTAAGLAMYSGRMKMRRPAHRKSSFWDLFFK